MTVVVLKTKRYFSCPYCGTQDLPVEHLFEMAAKPDRKGSIEAGPWACVNCNHRWVMTATVDGNLDVRPAREEQTRTMAVLMRLDTLDHGPLFLVLKSRYIGDKNGKLAEHADYHFHSHTCPTNYLRDIERIAIPGDSDPHGLFRLVASREWTESFDEILENSLDDDVEGLKRIFETDGEPMPSEWEWT